MDDAGACLPIRKRIKFSEIDVLVGGTPCQAFSVAGLRNSLSDERGNLTLIYVNILNQIDEARNLAGRPPAICLWENVPGVLTTKDNAFGCFLGALAGEDIPLEPPGGKWKNTGYVRGPQRTIAWRILDAQYFGVAQRRRRVFVVASARDDFDPAAVLFEFDGVRRDSAPSREAGEVAPTIPARSTGGGGLGTDFDCDGGVIEALAFQERGREGGRSVETNGDLAYALTAPNGGGRAQERNVAVSYAIQAGALRTNPDSGPDGVGVQADHAYTLEARAEVQCVAAPIAFHPTQDPISSTDGTTHGLGCGSSGGQASVAVAYGAFKGGQGADAGGIGWDEHITPTLSAADSGSNRVPVALTGAPIADVFPTLKSDHGRGQIDQDPHVAVAFGMQVRRLTPVECERLQGFPDDYTRIPSWNGWRKLDVGETPEALMAEGMKVKQNPKTGLWRVNDVDGPRYKALGNSWAVPVVAWIGKRIQDQLS